MADYSAAQLEQLWVKAGGYQTDAPLAAAVALAESSGDPNVVSKTNDVGLWQINLDAHPQYTAAELKDPLANARAAVDISHNGSSWSPWCTAWTDGACGTKGGHLAPAGDSPSGRIYRTLAAASGRRPPAHHDKPSTVKAPAGPSGPVGKPATLPKGFAALTYALGRTLPTRTKLANDASRRFMRAIR